MIRAIIVDDELSGRETLDFILKRFFAPQVDVLAMAASVKEAAELVAKFRPQLVFLDIEMPNELGLQLVNVVEKVDFEIIVTTAHREYGIDAIKAGVLDYLLKPIEIEELGKALEKFEKKFSQNEEQSHSVKPDRKQSPFSSLAPKIPILISSNKTIFVEPKTIIRCEADGNYTRIWFDSGLSELVTKLIKDLEEMLLGYGFFRVHKSHLINLNHVKAFMKLDDDIVMTNDSTVPLSRNLKAEFLSKMKLG